MADYGSMTVDKFYNRLISDGIILRKADISDIFKKIEVEKPGLSNIVSFQVAYDEALSLHEKVEAIRKARAMYTGLWDGVDQRRQNELRN